METLCSLPVILTVLVVVYLISKIARKTPPEEPADEDEGTLDEDIVMLDMLDDRWKNDL